MAAIFLLLVLGLFLFGGIAALYSILRMIGMLFHAIESLIFGVFGGIRLFCRLSYWCATALYRAARDTRQFARTRGLQVAQISYVRYFIWSHMFWSGYVRREIQLRGKSGIPSNQDI